MLEYDGLVDCFLGRMRNGYKVCRAKIWCGQINDDGLGSGLEHLSHDAYLLQNGSNAVKRISQLVVSRVHI